ncbi:MAG: DUF3131 domain-containing protein, partial [Candidatus Electrothrix sp. AUS1_2]|nr:DUF3131 domain-containing protein [Candidatus Electrothrix sp. AUS1_2]
MSISFKQGLLQARSHIAMILGLLLASGVVVALELWDTDFTAGKIATSVYHDDIPLPQPAPLRGEEREWAKIAWRYFENNWQQETGLVNSVQDYPATTLWDTASYLMALISSYRLEIIAHHAFDDRLSQALLSLEHLPLFADQLPNKSYNTKTLAMTDYANNPSPQGIGWSAIDLARLLVPLHIIVWNYPEHAVEVQKILRRWQWSALVKNGQLMGAVVRNGRTEQVQEGRLGYEQYAARAAALLGLDVSIAENAEACLKFYRQHRIDVPADRRDAKTFDALNYVVSEPYILDGLEFGGGRVMSELAWRVYRVQEEQYKATGIPTAVSEDHIDQAPYFVYNTVFVNGEFWKAVTDDGKDAEPFKTLSTKAAFGWHALYRTDYTKLLLDKVKTLHDPKRGWYAGIYEKNGKP